MPIRPAHPSDHPALLDLWLASVRATDTFLSEPDIQFFLPLVRDHALKQLDLHVLTADDDPTTPLAFLGLAPSAPHIEARSPLDPTNHPFPPSTSTTP